MLAMYIHHNHLIQPTIIIISLGVVTPKDLFRSKGRLLQINVLFWALLEMFFKSALCLWKYILNLLPQKLFSFPSKKLLLILRYSEIKKSGWKWSNYGRFIQGISSEVAACHSLRGFGLRKNFISPFEEQLETSEYMTRPQEV